MYSIIVVDDEAGISSRLKTIINSLDCGFTVIGEAKNGIEAQRIIKKLLPDVVITDIRMPECSGLELCRIVEQEYPGVIKVIISGYDDFSYAKEAMRYNVHDYLLKPVNIAELKKLLQSLEKKLNETRREMRLSEYLINCVSGEAIIMNCLNNINELVEAIRYKKEKLVYSFVESIVNFLKANNISARSAYIFLREMVSYCCLKLELEAASDELADEFAIEFSEHEYSEEEIYGRISERLESSANLLIKRYYETQCNDEKVQASKMQRYVQNHYSEDISLTTMSDVFHLNANYISSIFMEATGWNFKGYLSWVRLEQALKLLTEEQYSVSQISQMVGYDNPSYFGRFFKKYVGTSPERYRKVFCLSVPKDEENREKEK